jgi:hypothetical protein
MALTFLESNKVKEIKKILEKGYPQNVVFDNDKEEGLKMIAAEGGLWSLLQAAANLDPQRDSRYKDYDEMEDDSIVASALEMYVDDASQYSKEANATIWPVDDSQFKDDINELFELIDLENKCWGWIYNIAKYGDFFLRIHKEEGKGVTGVESDIHPSKVYRIDIDGKLVGFIVKDESCGRDHKDMAFDPADFVHFVNNYKPNFEKVCFKIEEDGVEVKKTATSLYGTSILQNARRVYKILNLLEVSLALARLARSPLIRVYYVNTTGMDPDSRAKLIKDIEGEFKKKKSINVKTDWYEQKYSPLNNTSDLFLPFTGETGDIRLESIGGDVDIKNIVDIDYMKNKLFGALRTPKQFLGFEEALPQSLESGKSLGRLDIRYARVGKKLQRSFLEGLYRLIQIHLSFKYRREQDVKDVHLALVPISSSEEDSRMEVLERKIGLAQSMLDLMGNTEETYSAKYLITYVFTRILDLPAFDLKKLLTGEKQTPEVPEEFKDLEEKLRLSIKSKCSSEHIVRIVESFLKSYTNTKKFIPRNRDLKQPTLSEGKIGKKRIIKRNHKG